MTIDPVRLDRDRERVTALSALRQTAAERAAHPPRIGPEAWRGPAYRAYLVPAEAVAAELHAVANELGIAYALARAELARGLA